MTRGSDHVRKVFERLGLDDEEKRAALRYGQPAADDRRAADGRQAPTIAATSNTLPYGKDQSNAKLERTAGRD
jgi:hypothetical protein